MDAWRGVAGGLDHTLQSILEQAEANEVEVVFALTKSKIAQVTPPRLPCCDDGVRVPWSEPCAEGLWWCGGDRHLVAASA